MKRLLILALLSACTPFKFAVRNPTPTPVPSAAPIVTAVPVRTVVITPDDPSEKISYPKEVKANERFNFKACGDTVFDAGDQIFADRKFLLGTLKQASAHCPSNRIRAASGKTFLLK
jgi:hypothetical protein